MLEINTNLSAYQVTLNEDAEPLEQTIFECMAEDADHTMEQAENAYPDCEVVRIMPMSEPTPTKVRLTLDVAYTLNGENPELMVETLRRLCTRAIGAGMLTGDTDAEIDAYTLQVEAQEDALTEEEVADYLLARIMSGNMLLEEVPVRMARYGMMEPNAFNIEMRERMGQ